MRFRVGREALGEAVAWVARALPSRPVVPVLSALLLQADDDGLTLSCFDYEVSARVRLEADVKEPGSALVPGRLLAEIIRSLPALDVEVATDADLVALTCGSAEFALVSLPVAEYPALPEAPPAAGTMDGGVLAVAAAQVVPAASRDDTLPMLTGVCLDIDDGTLTLAATDRYRLAVRAVPWHPARPGLRAAALVPARTLADAARAMAPGVPVAIAFDTGPEAEPARPRGGDAEPRPAEGMISFAIGGRRLTTRLIGGEFIRYRSRFPAEFGGQADVPGGLFTDAVRRVSLVADRASPVRLRFSPGSVLIEAQTEGRARAVETVPAEFHGTEPAIAFNQHYLLDGLTAALVPTPPAPEDGTPDPPDRRSAPRPGKPAEEDAAQVAGPELVRIEFTSPAKPALITRAPAPGGESEPLAEDLRAVPDFRYLVVPLRAVARP